MFYTLLCWVLKGFLFLSRQYLKIPSSVASVLKDYQFCQVATQLCTMPAPELSYSGCVSPIRRTLHEWVYNLIIYLGTRVK